MGKIVNLKEFEINNEIEYSKIDSNLFEQVGYSKEQSEYIASKPYSYWKTVGKLLFTNWGFIISILILLTIIILAIVVPIGHTARNNGGTLSPTEGISSEYWFGLGQHGDDYWIQIWSGVRTTLIFALVITIIQMVIGILSGSIWGYFNKSDIFFIQVTSLLSIVPQLILLLFIIFIFGASYWPIILGVSLQMWITIAASVRVQIMLVKNTDYNIASTTLGSNGIKIINKNIMPRILPVIVQMGSFSIPTAISIDASLSFLGSGFVDGTKTTSLGYIINTVMADNKWQIYPHLIIIPLAITAIISAIFFIVAKVFADSLDPRSHK